MLAFDAPQAVVQPAPVASVDDVIEVVGVRGGETLKIDRRVYRVQQTPHSTQKDAVELLRGLPAVTVTTDERILLLGSDNAKIFVDGRPYIGDANQYLRALHGDNIDRIEVVTNPSSQYSAEGAGGIINFVLRKKREDGHSGNESIDVSSYGRIMLDTALKVRRGKLTYELQGGGNLGAMTRSTYHRVRSVEAKPGAPTTVNSESGDSRYMGSDGRLSAKVTYDLDSRTSIAAKLGGGGGRDTLDSNIRFEGLTPDFQSVTERQRLLSIADYLTADLNLDHKGGREGETLSAALQLYGNPLSHDVTTARFSDGSSFSIFQGKTSFTGHGQADWVRPLGKGELFSLGGSWDIDQTSQHYRFSSAGAVSALGADAADQYSAHNITGAIYASFQESVGKLIVVPGVRAEWSRRRISSPGLDDVRRERTSVYPSFHLKYSLGQSLDFTASYSKRVDRAPLEYLRPYRSTENATTIFVGSPRLQDQSTDAFEANIHYNAHKVDAGVIAYLRKTSALWSKSYSTNSSGSTIYTYVNAGSRRDIGVEFDIGAPLLPRIKANASVNLFDQRSPANVDSGQQTVGTFRYTTNGTLQWTRPDRGKVPGDVAQLQWTFNSASQSFQLRERAWTQLSASYTHSLTPTLSLSGTMQYFGSAGTFLRAPLVSETYTRQRSPEFKIKLLKTFGRP